MAHKLHITRIDDTGVGTGYRRSNAICTRVEASSITEHALGTVISPCLNFRHSSKRETPQRDQYSSHQSGVFPHAAAFPVMTMALGDLGNNHGALLHFAVHDLIDFVHVTLPPVF